MEKPNGKTKWKKPNGKNKIEKTFLSFPTIENFDVPLKLKLLRSMTFREEQIQILAKQKMTKLIFFVEFHR